MNEHEADVVYDRLLARLDRATAMLRERREEHWAAWLAADAERIRAGDAYGLRHLLTAYGGMGSINDRAHTRDRLSVLLSGIYDDAAALQRDLGSA